MYFIPYQKLSKKAKRALDLERRATWKEICPVTRTAPVRKLYNRAELKRETRLLANSN